MLSDQYDFWAGVGAILSSIASVYFWLNSMGLVPLFTFIAGACFTLWTQERLEKKRRERLKDMKMSEHVYGPLYKGLKGIWAELEAFGPASEGSLSVTVDDWRFSLVGEDLGSRIKAFQERLRPYYPLWSDARRETESHVMKWLGKHEIKWEVVFEIWAGHERPRIPLTTPIFEDKTPLEYLTDKTSRYRNASIIVYAHGKSLGQFSKDHKVNQISTEMIKEARENSIIQQQRSERKELLKDCSSLIEAVEKKIVL